MQVRAKYQLAYQGTLHFGNSVFDMEEKDYATYKNDVEIVKPVESFASFRDKKVINKPIKKARIK